MGGKSDRERSETDLESSLEGTLREEYEDKRLSRETYKAALRDHRHHLVRETTSQVTVEDVYCSTH